MSSYEYKTVALPAVVRGRRRRRQSEADLVAETLGETIAAEAVDGWEYMRAETLSAAARGGMFGPRETETAYTVLVFRRVKSAVWKPQEMAMAAEPAQAVQPAPEPAPRRALPPASPSVAVAEQRRSLTEPVVDGPPPVPPAPGDARSIRPPLGSAED